MRVLKGGNKYDTKLEPFLRIPIDFRIFLRISLIMLITLHFEKYYAKNIRYFSSFLEQTQRKPVLLSPVSTLVPIRRAFLYPEQ